MKKRSILAFVIIIAAAVALSACGSRPGNAPEGSSTIEAAAASKGNLISVDLKNLPKEIKESDLVKEGSSYFINQYDLMDIAKKEKKDIVIETADGYKITAFADGSELTKVPLKKDTKEQETTTKKDSGTSSGTNTGGTTNNGGSVNTGGGTSAGGSVNTGGAFSGTNQGGTTGGNTGGNTAPTQPPAETPTQPAHTHSYTIYQGGTPATCTSTGTEVYACSCGATTTKTTPMTAHSFVPVYWQEDQGWNEDIIEYHTVCNGCGMYLDGMSYDDIANHIAECGPGSYSGKNVVVGQKWHSNLVDVLDHYECPVCGAWQ